MEAGALTRAGAGAPGASGGSLLVGLRPRRGEQVIKALLATAAFLSVLTTVGIVFSLLRETVAFFGEVSLGDFLTGKEWTPLFADPQFGVLPLITGTLVITAIALAVAIPLGLGAAVYLSEYANTRVRRIVKPVLELLAGIPTIVFGYFALTWFTPTILEDVLRLDVGTFNAAAAGIVMGFMVLPTVASLSEDAMRAVPMGLREGAFGLGATRRQVALRVVMPAALSGIVAAIVLGISRAIGETMIVLVAAGLVPNFGVDVTQPTETMTAFIGSTANGDLPQGSVAYKTIFAVGTTLFVMTLILNFISIRFVRRFRQVYE